MKMASNFYKSLITFALLLICGSAYGAVLPNGHKSNEVTLQTVSQSEPVYVDSNENVESIKRSSASLPNEPSQQNVYFPNPMHRMSPTFENVPAQYIGPNYAISKPNGAFLEDNKGFGSGHAMTGLYSSLVNSANKPSMETNDDTINDMFTSTFKKYNVKQYLLKKILGNTHDIEEDDAGFFSNKHLKRHGTAGVAAKVLGELIGIKIRESIEGIGKSVSEYAKDFTSRNFVNMGQLFAKFLRIQ